jgi:WD40 repeat protein
MVHRSPITCVDHHLGHHLGHQLGHQLGNHSGIDTLVTGGYDGRVVAWDADGSERWATDFDDLVNDVRIDPSGTRVAVAAADRFAFILDLRDGSRVEMFGPHGDDVNAVRWSPDGSKLACVMDHHDIAIRIWEQTGPTGQSGTRWTSTALHGHESGVFAVAFDPTGTKLATVAEDATARIWDVATGAQIHVLQHPGDPEALDWSPDGSVVITGCDDGVARIWDPTTGSLIRTLTDARAAVRFVRFDATGERVMIGAYDATMRAYETKSWQLTDTFIAPFQWERAGSFTRHGVAIGSFAGRPVEHPARPTSDLPLTVGINSLAVADGRQFVGRDDGAVVDLINKTVITRHDTIVNTVTISPDGQTIASGDYRGGIHLNNLADGSVLVARAENGGPINSIAWHPTESRFFSGGYDGHVREWTANGDCTRTFRAHHGPIKSLAWSTSANLLVAGSSDGSLSSWRGGVEQWRATTDDLVLVNAVACANEANTVVTASRDLRVRIWDASTGALLETLGAGHLKSIKAIAVTSDGNTILTGSYDGTAMLWRRAHPRANWTWLPLRVHGKPGVPAVAIGTDGLYTAGWNGTVARWSFSGELQAEYPVHHVS